MPARTVARRGASEAVAHLLPTVYLLATLLALVPGAAAQERDWHTDRVGPVRLH